MNDLRTEQCALYKTSAAKSLRGEGESCRVGPPVRQIRFAASKVTLRRGSLVTEASDPSTTRRWSIRLPLEAALRYGVRRPALVKFYWWAACVVGGTGLEPVAFRM